MSRLDRWRRAVEPIGHSRYPFLDPTYSPESRVPCRGYVEWIAEAWLAGDVDSIVELFCQILAANPGVGLIMSVAVSTSENDDAVTPSIDHADADHERLARMAGQWPRDFQAVSLEGTITGLDCDQMANLVAAFMLQSCITGCRNEAILIGSGRHLMAASILPWDFQIPRQDESIEYVNAFIEQRRQEAPAWRDIPLYESHVLARFDPQRLAPLQPILSDVASLSVSARMHLLDAIRYAGFSKKPRPLETCTLYDTRRFGCYVSDTSSELLSTGLVNTDCTVDMLANWFTKAELKVLLARHNFQFRKSSTLAELFGLARQHFANTLVEAATKAGFFRLSEDLQRVGEDLLSFSDHQATRLAFWAASTIAPALRKRGENGC